MNLSERAEAIIMQKGHTDEDITELCRIRWAMARAYKKWGLLTASEEESYKLARGDNYIKCKQQKKSNGKPMTENESTTLSVNKSERDHGKFRTLKATASGFNAEIDAITGFIIHYHKSQSNENDAMLSGIDSV